MWSRCYRGCLPLLLLSILPPGRLSDCRVHRHWHWHGIRTQTDGSFFCLSEQTTERRRFLFWNWNWSMEMCGFYGKIIHVLNVFHILAQWCLFDVIMTELDLGLNLLSLRHWARTRDSEIVCKNAISLHGQVTGGIWFIFRVIGI